MSTKIASANESHPALTKTSMFSRMNYQVERGMNEILATHTLTKGEWRIVLEFFHGRCAFCGIEHTGNKRTGIIPDHLIAASKYGELCIGNVVPACHTCNDRRGDKPWAEYLKGLHLENGRRNTRRIKAYLDKYPYRIIDDPKEVLSKIEHAEFKRIKKAWAELWKDAKALRDKVNYRRRRNLTNR